MNEGLIIYDFYNLPLPIVFGGSRHIINTQIINPPGPVLVTTHGKATKSFFSVFLLANSADPDEMLRFASSHLGLCCLYMLPFQYIQPVPEVGTLYFKLAVIHWLKQDGDSEHRRTLDKMHCIIPLNTSEWLHLLDTIKPEWLILHIKGPRARISKLGCT